jgi:hypothetical protein
MFPFLKVQFGKLLGTHPLQWVGWLMAFAAVPHLLFVAAGFRPWEGSQGFRKPILFFVSTGMTVWSLGYIRTLFSDPRKRLGIVNGCLDFILAVSLILEVALIAKQAWRRVHSHFNQATPTDRAVEIAMLVCIFIASLIILRDCIRVFRPLSTDIANALAIRTGMVLLMVSVLIGYTISVYGWMQLSAGGDPTTVPPRGVMKFPHGAAIHALQLLPCVSWLAWAMQSRQAVLSVQLAIASQCTLLVYAIRQTCMGLDRWEIIQSTDPQIPWQFSRAIVGPYVGPSLLLLVGLLGGLSLWYAIDIRNRKHIRSRINQA